MSREQCSGCHQDDRHLPGSKRRRAEKGRSSNEKLPRVTNRKNLISWQPSRPESTPACRPHQRLPNTGRTVASTKAETSSDGQHRVPELSLAQAMVLTVITLELNHRNQIAISSRNGDTRLSCHVVWRLWTCGRATAKFFDSDYTYLQHLYYIND